MFDRTVVPRDFDTIEVPFPEKGEPRAAFASDGGPTAPGAGPVGTLLIDPCSRVPDHRGPSFNPVP